MHILVYQNDRSRNASSDRKMNHIILLVNVQTFQKYNYYYYFLFIGCNHKMWFQGGAPFSFQHFMPNPSQKVTTNVKTILHDIGYNRPTTVYESTSSQEVKSNNDISYELSYLYKSIIAAAIFDCALKGYGIVH